MSLRPTLRSLALLVSLLGAVACGGDSGDDDGDGTGADASTEGQPDGGDTSGEPDADTPTASALGTSCTGAGQGDCPDGFVCLPLQSGSWCSKTCGTWAPNPTPNDAACAEGYEGPGKPGCFLGIRTQGGEMDPNMYCGVMCEDLVDGAICDAETCDGTCPGELACEGPILGQDMNQVATSCQ